MISHTHKAQLLASSFLLLPSQALKEPGLGDELVGSCTRWGTPQHMGLLVSGVISLKLPALIFDAFPWGEH